MKTKLFTAAVLFGSFGLALTNCGGDSGGSSPKPFLNLKPDTIKFLNPPEGSITANFCRYGGYKVEVEGDACDSYAADPNAWLELRRTGDTSGASIPLTKGFATQANGVCTLEGIQPAVALVEGVEHTLQYKAAPGGTGVEKKFVKFVSSLRSQDATACAGSNFMAIGTNIGNGQISGTAVDTFGTVDASGNYVFDWDDLFQTAIITNLNSFVSGLTGVGNWSKAYPAIFDFNDTLDPERSISTIGLFSLQGYYLGPIFIVTGIGEQIPLSNGCLSMPDYKCVEISGVTAKVHFPNVAGALPNGHYAIIMTRATRGLTGKYLDKTYMKSFNLTD